jgi:hypothetical protein
MVVGADDKRGEIDCAPGGGSHGAVTGNSDEIENEAEKDKGADHTLRRWATIINPIS